MISIWVFISCVLVVKNDGVSGLCKGAKDCQTPRTIEAIHEIHRRTASVSSFNFQLVDKPTDDTLEPDLLLEEKVALTILDEVASITPQRQKRKTFRFDLFPDLKWPDQTVRWRFDSTHNSKEQQIIRDAIKIWEDATCIKFIEVAEDSKEHHLLFNKGSGNGCLTFLGRSPSQSPQPMYLDAGCFARIGTPVHELGHVLGLFHEHSRPDRDQYINVNLENLKSSQRGNYFKFSHDLISTQNIPYDMASIMHYGGYDYSTNGKQVLTTKDPRYQSTIGQREELSFADLKAVNMEYCSGNCSSQPLTCLNNGYQNPKDCSRCICPDGFVGSSCQNVAISQGDPCGGVIKASSSRATIESPGYGNGHFRDSQECTWKIKASPGKRIEVRFVDDFRIFCIKELCIHYVEIRQKIDMSISGPRFCCGTVPNETTISEGTELMVLLRAKSHIKSNIQDRRGFKLQYVEVPADTSLCNPNPCNNGGVCNPSGNTFQCQCPQGYSGRRCEDRRRLCNSQPCHNGATCVDVSEDYKCECGQGFTGRQCETDINECASFPCYNDAICMNQVGYYDCRCGKGFTGDRCQFRKLICDSHPCSNGGTCQEIDNENYKCHCRHGFEGRTCEIDINECASFPCYNDAICMDQVGYYDCRCGKGFTGDRCQFHKRFCASGPCYNGGDCQDNEGGYRCQCRRGYTGGRCETDIDECQAGLCQNGATCVDQIAGFICSCRKGTNGHLCQYVDHPCESSPCVNGGDCVEDGGSYRCVCRAGTGGRNCQMDEINECESSPCQNGGQCLNLLGKFQCQCPDRYRGSLCEIPPHVCENSPCMNGATCDDGVNYQFICRCRTGFTGRRCETEINECSSRPCLNNGLCIDMLGGYRCNCRSGFYGNRCQNVVNPCRSNPCREGSTCHSSGSHYSCSCAPGYTGYRCNIDIDECHHAPCANDGVCTNLQGSYSCSCKNGFSGPNCETEIPYACSVNPCENGGTCKIKKRGKYKCVCPDGFRGDHCQNVQNKDCGGCGMENRPNIYKPCIEEGEEIHKIPYQCACSKYETRVIHQTRSYFSWGRRHHVSVKVRVTVCVEHKMCYHTFRSQKTYCCKGAIKLESVRRRTYCAVPGYTDWSHCSKQCGGCGCQRRFKMAFRKICGRKRAVWEEDVKNCNFNACPFNQNDYNRCPRWKRREGLCDIGQPCCGHLAAVNGQCVEK